MLSKKPTLELDYGHNYSLEVVAERSRSLTRVGTDRNIQTTESESCRNQTDNSCVSSLNKAHRRRSLTLDRDNLPIDIHRADLGNIRIVDLQWRAAFTLEQSPVDADYKICVPISGWIEWHDSVYPATTTALVIAPGRHFPEMTSKEGRLLVVGYDRQTLDRVLANLLDRVPKQPLLFDSTIDLTTDFGNNLRQFVEFLGCKGDAIPTISSPLMQEKLESALLACLIEGVNNNYSDEILYRTQGAVACCVNKACAFIESHLHEEIELAQIAAAASVSPRLLQKAFAQQHECSPMRFLTRSRLHRIRQDLERASANTRIIDVMMNYGITQGGKFAKEYLQLFGEKPSDTLKRANQSERANYRHWQEIDDFRSEEIVGGVAPPECRAIDFPQHVLQPLFAGDPLTWNGYLHLLGIVLAERLDLW